jgi:dTDP-4-dehydrorhamnose 3,5-epimerase
MIEVIGKPLPGVTVLRLFRQEDGRGSFHKIYNETLFKQQGLNFSPKECFISRSSHNVLRGMHYQGAPRAQAKLISCMSGTILDVVVNINKSSREFGEVYAIKMRDDDNFGLLVSPDYAHGFYCLGDDNIVAYLASEVYSPEDDAGILWSSIDYKWPTVDPIVSERDLRHPTLSYLK